MELELRRVIIFALDINKLADFYAKVLGLRLMNKEDGWVDFEAGGCRVALHTSRAKASGRPPKLCFFASDVAATRNALLKRGAKEIGPVKSTSTFDMCDGKDPEGNPFQISSRK